MSYETKMFKPGLLEFHYVLIIMRMPCLERLVFILYEDH